MRKFFHRPCDNVVEARTPRRYIAIVSLLDRSLNGLNRKQGSVLTLGRVFSGFRERTNHLSSLNASVASGGNWMRMECSRPIH